VIRLLRRITPPSFAQRLGIMMAEFGRLLRSEIFLLGRVQVLLHLLHDMFSFVEVLNIQICRAPGNLLRMAALRTELPLLETVHVRERTARRAPDDKVHDKEVIGVIVINKYRRFAEKPGIPQPRAPRETDRMHVPGEQTCRRTLMRSIGNL
jgi:hypothetical protein